MKAQIDIQAETLEPPFLLLSNPLSLPPKKEKKKKKAVNIEEYFRVQIVYGPVQESAEIAFMNEEKSWGGEAASRSVTYVPAAAVRCGVEG